MPKESRNTFNNDDPARRFNQRTPATPIGRARVPRRRLENLSSESSNSSTDRSSSSSMSPVGSSPTTEPEPDLIEVPTSLESYETLLWMGLSEVRAEEIWNRWKNVNLDNYNGDFGHFVRQYLKSLVEAERCDTGEPGINWSPHLRKIGANKDLTDAIANQGPQFDGVRLTKSAAEWVDQAIDWRWEYLLYISKASGERAKGGVPPPSGTTSSPVQVRMVTESELDSEDVAKFTYDRKKNIVTDANGKALDYIPLWRGTSRVRAEHMWAEEHRQGKFDISNQLCEPATDFFGRIKAQYWTPDVHGAQVYADYAKKHATPAGVCLIRIEVPLSLIKQQPKMLLEYPNENWKRTIWFSRQGNKIEPKDLQREILKKSLLIGDIASGINSKYCGMSDWKQVTERCILKGKDGKKVTQFVFGHVQDDDIEDEMNKLESRTTIRKSENPRMKLPPMSAQALDPSKK